MKKIITVVALSVIIIIITISGLFNVTNSVAQIGGGNPTGSGIPLLPLVGSFTLPATAIGIASCTSQTAVTITGLAATGACFASPAASLGNIFLQFVPAAGSVTPVACNPTAAAITPTATVIQIRCSN